MIKILAREIGVGISVVLGVLRAEFTEFDLLGSLTKGKLKGDLPAVYSYQMGGCGKEQSQPHLRGVQWKEKRQKEQTGTREVLT